MKDSDLNNLPNPNLYLSARISNLWNKIMIIFGYNDFCESTTQFNWINYNYTNDAPPECIEMGEKLWKLLFEYLGKDGVGGQVEIGKSPMSTVSRRHKLWNK